jgi:hypothetical protein
MIPAMTAGIADAHLYSPDQKMLQQQGAHEQERKRPKRRRTSNGA